MQIQDSFSDSTEIKTEINFDSDDSNKWGKRGSEPTRDQRRSIKPPLIQLIIRRLGWPSFWFVLFTVLIVPTACFLALAISPRLFGQAGSWLSFSAFRTLFHGETFRGVLDSLGIGASAALLASIFGGGLAWVIQRTTIPGRRYWTLGIWVVLLVPSYMIAAGWQVVLGQGGILSSLGIYSPLLRNLFFGPVGYALILAIRGVPFAYLAIVGPLAALSSSYDEAARVHGANRIMTFRIVAPILLPAIFAAQIIVFAESIADFGTAAVIAPNAHFPIATYDLFTALSSYPANFTEAAVIGWALVALVSLALFGQRRFMKKRSFAVLGGRSRFAKPHKLDPAANMIVFSAVVLFFVLALAVPVLGAVGSSLLTPFATFSISHFTLSAYHGIFTSHFFQDPLSLSFRLAVINGCVTVVLAGIVARRIGGMQQGTGGRILDATLLAAIALPALVLAAGFIFAYNLPFLSQLGIHLYGTLFLLAMAYAAGALPSASRILVGPMAQIQSSLLGAARVHGAGPVEAWRKGVLPLLAPSLILAWMFTFASTFLELPASELLSPPGQSTVSVTILQIMNKSDLFRGAALTVIALLIDLGIILLIILLFRLLAPKGWKRTGAQIF